MAELDERLKRLLSDENSMKKVVDVASVLIGQNQTAPSSDDSSSNQGKEPDQTDLSSILSSFLSGSGNTSSEKEPSEENHSSEQNHTQGKGADKLMEILPIIMGAVSGNGSYLPKEKVNLIEAMKPYMSASRLSSVERAMKMANIAKAAKSALVLLGR